MLQAEIIEQLRSVFAKLDRTIELAVMASDHPKQHELLEMLHAVASTSEKIVVVPLEEISAAPRFTLNLQGKPTGISFAGIPGGHEFSSLILAILNVDGKGKMPDAGVISRIQNLRGPIRLRTFISLTCENCPDAVQALNLMAALHADFEHTMIDGEFAIDEVESLGIQGVPSVMNGTTLVSSGKVTFSELLQKLEKEFGISDTERKQNKDLGSFDLVVMGGGPAGASSAIYAARKGMRVAIITDRLGGQLQDTKGIENLISVPYTQGAELSANLFKHVADYPIDVFEHRRVESIENGAPKLLRLDTGEFLHASSIIVATGAKWRNMGVPGEREYIGRGVAYCPHCDGPYYKGKDVAVIGGGNSGVEAAIDLSNIVKSVTVIEFAPTLKADQILIDKMNATANIRVIKNARSTAVVGNGEKVIGLDYEDRETKQALHIDLDGVFVQIGLVPNSEIVRDLVATTPQGEIIVDSKCRTNVNGIYAAGDVTTVPFKQIVVSIGEGAKAALTAYEHHLMSNVS